MNCSNYLKYHCTSQFPWAAPIEPVVKPDCSIRVCVDYRSVNAMPLVEELIGRVSNCGFFSIFDLSKGFLPGGNGGKFTR